MKAVAPASTAVAEAAVSSTALRLQTNVHLRRTALLTLRDEALQHFGEFLVAAVAYEADRLQLYSGRSQPLFGLLVHCSSVSLKLYLMSIVRQP